MNNRDWEQFGNDIFRTVQDAVESCNYDKLNQNISDAVNQVVDSVSRNVKQTKEHMQDAKRRQADTYTYQEAGRTYRNQGYTYQQPYEYGQSQSPAVYRKQMPSRAGSIILTTFGGIIAGGSVIGMMACLIIGILTGIKALWGGVIGTSIGVLLGIVMLSGGIKRLGQIKRFKKYLNVIGEKDYCNIETLVSSVGKTAKFVIKDLEKMIQKGWFTQGHLDQKKTCLMLTDQMYEQYQQLERQKAQLQKEEALAAKERKRREEAEARAQQEKRSTLTPEVQKIIGQGDAFVKKIRECNDAIPGEEISAKMDRMEMIVDRIFDRVEEYPESVSAIRKLLDYYLPTTVKLLEAYAQMDAQPIGGENIASAKKEIEATIDTLNVAFEKILDSLFQDTAWDVSSDISVLNTILAQEGLKEDGLKK